MIKRADRRAVARAVEQYAHELRARHPEVQRVIWFGSWVNGIPRPGSDVDLCLVLYASDKPRRERVADYLPDRFPAGMDLFPYTHAELQRLAQSSPGWHAAMMAGREVGSGGTEMAEADFSAHSRDS